MAATPNRGRAPRINPARKKTPAGAKPKFCAPPLARPPASDPLTIRAARAIADFILLSEAEQSEALNHIGRFLASTPPRQALFRRGLQNLRHSLHHQQRGARHN